MRILGFGKPVVSHRYIFFTYRKDSSNSMTQINSTQQFFVTVLLLNRDSFKLDTQILALL